MSERSIQIQTQGPFGADTTSISYESINPSAIPGGSVAKPRFVDFACPYSEVRLSSIAVVVIDPTTSEGIPLRCYCDEGNCPEDILGKQEELPNHHES